MVRSTVEQDQECAEHHDFFKIYVASGVSISILRPYARSRAPREMTVLEGCDTRPALDESRAAIIMIGPQASPAVLEMPAVSKRARFFPSDSQARACSVEREQRRPTSSRHARISVVPNLIACRAVPFA
jgi:hypothetical protein